MTKSTTRTKESQCPMCDKSLDTATGVRDETLAPLPGDISLCWGCGAILQLKEDLTLERAATENLSEVEPEELQELYRFQKLIRI